MNELDAAIQEFVLESRENLDQFDRDLLAIEKDPGNRDLLDRIFRTVHTIKGTCGFFDLPRLESVAHAGENLLSSLRDGERTWTRPTTDALLRLGDAVRRLLSSIEQTGRELDEDFGPLIACLDQLRHDAPTDLDEPAQPATGSSPGAADAEAADLTEGTLRVDVHLLDKLMNLVGELVLARNQVVQLALAQRDPVLQTITQRLNLITSELQGGVMKARMQPINAIWSRFPRLVRDLAGVCGKQARIEMEGRDTELDKTIIEAIKGPLTHALRNAIDHGIEPPHRRIAAGKPPEGRIGLRAFHEGGMVSIEVSDDGAGFDLERIRRKAIERGLVAADVASRLDEAGVLNLIFEPGFSTADAVTNVSGRGVGMDVVRTNIERIGGTVDIQGSPGQGATLKIKIPLTLAIIPALILGARGERYALPQASLLELMRLEPDGGAGKGLEWIQGVPIFRLRGELLPIVELDAVLGNAVTGLRNSVEPSNLVVLQTDDRRFGLVVPEIHDSEEIVVKPLAPQLKRLSIFAGTTILGDGNVALILDVGGISRHAGMSSAAKSVLERGKAAISDLPREAEATFLIIADQEDRRMAIPLDAVLRLEWIDPRSIERTCTSEVVQYRGGILPLQPLGRPRGVTESIGLLQVVVTGTEERPLGLVVDQIVDIAGTVRNESQRSTLLLQKRVTDVLDVASLLNNFATEP